MRAVPIQAVTRRSSNTVFAAGGGLRGPRPRTLSPFDVSSSRRSANTVFAAGDGLSGPRSRTLSPFDIDSSVRAPPTAGKSREIPDSPDPLIMVLHESVFALFFYVVRAGLRPPRARPRAQKSRAVFQA